MTTRQDELEDFKRQINLTEYAAGQGYEIDRKASSRNSVGMRCEGDKIIIGMGHDQHWVYFSVHDPADHGSIIDFVQKRQGLNLGQVRRELRPWLDAPGSFGSSSTPLPRPPAHSYVERLEPVVTDLNAVRAAYEAAQSVSGSGGHHPYLCDTRAIPAALLASERFRERVRIDQHGNALFPHWNLDTSGGSGGKQLCGFEKKNDGFTGFASGGTKGLWCSNATDQDRRLVIAETAIDALSYATLFGFEDARFFSIAGQMNPQQPGLLNRAIRVMPTGSQVVLAVDHDDGGDMITQYIEPIFNHVRDMLGRDDLELVIDKPPTPGADWNDALRECGDPPEATAPLPSSGPE